MTEVSDLEAYRDSKLHIKYIPKKRIECLVFCFIPVMNLKSYLPYGIYIWLVNTVLLFGLTIWSPQYNW